MTQDTAAACLRAATATIQPGSVNPKKMLSMTTAVVQGREKCIGSSLRAIEPGSANITQALAQNDKRERA